MNQDRVRRHIEVEYNCEVTDLVVRPVGADDLYKVEGTAFRRGRKLLIGGHVRPHNVSTVDVWEVGVDDPFADLPKYLG